MTHATWLIRAAALALFSTAVCAQVPNYQSVTQRMLENPDPADWLMFSRTYDAQRYSPLDEINVDNVRGLTLAWTSLLGSGNTETIPLVHDGVMYVVMPGAIVQALNAATGEVFWQYTRPVAQALGASARTKNLAIFGDTIVYTAPDSYVVGLDARTGEMRWETQAGTRGHTSGPLIVDGLAITGGACSGNRDNCYIAAHDVATGKEAWRFYTTPAPGEPGDESWHGAPLNNRQASTWGLPGSYDAASGLLYWGVANAMPDHRAARHGGDPAGTGISTPADLYSNSTLALNPKTGRLNWYYQHLPGDDWDLDATHERVLLDTALTPDPRYVKWINPALQPGERRDVMVTVPEGGGIWALDRHSGEFLWATPFPYDAPEFWLDHIDPATGTVTLKWDLVLKEPGETKTICYWNTRSYWPTSYHPGTNSLYTSYSDVCRELTSANAEHPESWRVVPRPGSDPNALAGLAKIDMATGEIVRFDVGRVPGNGALLTTAGNLVFHGDMNRRFKAFDARNGELLWETVLGGNVSVSTISYAADGRQYIAVMTGENLKLTELLSLNPELSTPRGHNALYVFALPQ
ncbi:MAG TPA: PQQ-binding-like beta-propeller repeat protein [Hyphomicrobiales bacterium]|nr:PQQ-binding-like beta-propeller repeat protein [Hyphomicrobiales bacterium]